MSSLLVQFLAYVAVYVAFRLLFSLVRSARRSRPGRARSFWWQFNQAWQSVTQSWGVSFSPYDPDEEELVRLVGGDRRTARRLMKGAGSADRAIAQLLRDRR
jgi:hypothetical protein